MKNRLCRRKPYHRLMRVIMELAVPTSSIVRFRQSKQNIKTVNRRVILDSS